MSNEQKTELKTEYKPTYWEIKSDNIIVKRISDTEVYQVQVHGRELTKDFIHTHTRTTFPEKARLDEYLEKFTPSTDEEYDILLAAHFQITAHKRDWFNEYRQRKYDLKVKSQYEAETLGSRPTVPPPSPYKPL